mgnify:CR=1 FL=1
MTVFEKALTLLAHLLSDLEDHASTSPQIPPQNEKNFIFQKTRQDLSPHNSKRGKVSTHLNEKVFSLKIVQ